MSKQEFDRLVESWAEYAGSEITYQVRIPTLIRKHDSFEAIAEMGHQALPWIRELYDADSSDDWGLSTVQAHGLHQLVNEIVGGACRVPEESRGRITQMQQYAKDWLDQNMSRYVKEE